MRLIDADAIQIPKTHADAFENCRNCELLDADQVREIIDSAPTIEPKRGEWIEFDTKWGRSLYYCTNCMETSEVPTAFGKPLYNFCPNCGADMRKESE